MADAHEGAAPPGAVAPTRIPVEGYQSLLLAWAGMHGFACLEAFGYFDWLSEQARDELFRSQAMLLTQAIGGPLPERATKPVRRPNPTEESWSASNIFEPSGKPAADERRPGR